MFGKDIYWYGVQAISLLETGELHSPDRSPVFRIVAFLFSLMGVSEDNLFYFQLVTVVWLLFCLYLSRFLLKTPIDKWNVFPSAMVFVLGFLYPKQAWALGFLFLSIALYFSKLISRPIIRWIGSLIFLVFATWFHAMVGVIGLGVWILFHLPRKYDMILFLSALVLPLLVKSETNERLVVDTKTFPIFAAYGMVGFGILWDWMRLVFGKNSLLSHEPIEKTISFLGLLLVVPIFHFADIQFRILISILLIGSLFTLGNRKEGFITLMSFILWVTTLVQSPHLFSYPYELMWNPGEKAASIPDNGLLVAHHGFCEYYHFHFRRDCMSWEPDEKAIREMPFQTKIYRLVYGIRMENLRASKENGLDIFSYIEPLGEYQLVLEDEWNHYIHWLEKRNSKLLSVAKSWKNPYRKRPSFIQRKQNYGI
ncbi:hypothetical protein [Leptospira paudalimensis]|uniref:Glycosyltransferase RgtA/B/C/D-like domain-containing protein n=1 Tax=Leptospira paudalimensis TaxID=2950024 RepID=A0ABT3M2N5_9LEPT|nr:hypothetical protein [Leptospira paudalimensis]MCW7502650.1 hypothetical protein [Leptospira paudalimensis]